jgi:hypothetical protein
VPNTVEVTLPTGLWVEGSRRQDAALRPPTGDDETFLLEDAEGLSPARRTTALLARCLVRLGPFEPPEPGHVRALTAGDREALLLHLHRLAYGERLDCVLACPEPACGELLELELRVCDLVLAPYEHARPEHESGGIRFRLPTGGDLEAAAERAGGGLDSAVHALEERCGLAGRADGALDDLLAGLDPQADLRLEMTCPACGHAFSAMFDAGDFLAQKLARDADAVLREIHLLALHYHWPESELRAMPPRRRRRYLAVLTEGVGA